MHANMHLKLPKYALKMPKYALKTQKYALKNPKTSTSNIKKKKKRFTKFSQFTLAVVGGVRHICDKAFFCHLGI